MNTVQNASLVVMGVAGCGKSSLGAGLAERLGLPLIEGDDHHSPSSRDKMRQGIADDDWMKRVQKEPHVIYGAWLKTYRPSKPVILAAGEEGAVERNDIRAGREKNRRVEIWLK